MSINPSAFTFVATNAEYHARIEISRSQIEDFIASPQTFHGRHVTKRLPKRKLTKALEFGNRVHSKVLEPELLLEIPADVLAVDGSKKGNRYKAWEAEHRDFTILKADEIAPLALVEKAIWEHPKASAVLYGPHGEREKNIAWKDKETGLWLRCRLDRVVKPLLCDLKTARDVSAEAFYWACMDHGYHRQAAFYRWGWEALTGEQWPFGFVVVSNDVDVDNPNIEVEFYEMGEDLIKLGEEQERNALRQIAKCRETGFWKRPGWGEIRLLSAPRSARYANQWETE